MLKVMLNVLALLILCMVWQRWGMTWHMLAAATLVLVLLRLTLIDMRSRLLPDRITQPLLWLGLLVNLNGMFVPLRDAVIGAVAGYGLLWFVAAVYFRIQKKHGIGRGDFKLVAALGAWLGWQTLPELIVLASVAGVLVALFISWRYRQAILQTSIPFGPFLAAASILSLLSPGWLWVRLAWL